MDREIRVVSEGSKEARLYTHTAPHHADEVFATAMLSFIESPVVMRTRNRKILEEAEGIVYDVGGCYDAGRNRFDHHQTDFTRAREDGIKYSSAGLIWETYGLKILEEFHCREEFLKDAHRMIDERLVRGIDARDNGQLKEAEEMTLSSVISLMNAGWDEDEESSVRAFIQACRLAREVLSALMKKIVSELKGKRIVEELIGESTNNLLIMPGFIDGWIPVVLKSEHPRAASILYGIYQTREGNWGIRALPSAGDDVFGQRKAFPSDWRGLSGEELEKASGVEGAVFCHKEGFFAVAKGREEAIKLAKESVLHTEASQRRD